MPVGEEAEVADAHETTGADAGVSGAGTLSKAQALSVFEVQNRHARQKRY